MIGHTLVLDTPYFTRPDGNGNFRLADVPAAAGDLVVWHERSIGDRIGGCTLRA